MLSKLSLGRHFFAIPHRQHPAGDGGQVVFMTQQALLRLPYFHQPDDWHVIINEIPAPDLVFAKHLPHNHEIITSAISWSDFSADNVGGHDRAVTDKFLRGTIP